MLNILYKFIWWIIKRLRTKVVNFEKEYPKYTHQDDKVAAKKLTDSEKKKDKVKKTMA